MKFSSKILEENEHLGREEKLKGLIDIEVILEPERNFPFYKSNERLNYFKSRCDRTRLKMVRRMQAQQEEVVETSVEDFVY